MLVVLIGGPSDGRRVEVEGGPYIRVPRIVPMRAVAISSSCEDIGRMEVDEYEVIRLSSEASIGLHISLNSNEIMRFLVGGYRHEIAK